MLGFKSWLYCIHLAAGLTFKSVIILIIVYHYHTSTMSSTLSLAWNTNTMSCMENLIVCKQILRLLILINYRLLVLNSFQGVYRWKTLSFESYYFEKKSLKYEFKGYDFAAVFTQNNSRSKMVVQPNLRTWPISFFPSKYFVGHLRTSTNDKVLQ